jgi:hypothetical protein
MKARDIKAKRTGEVVKIGPLGKDDGSVVAHIKTTMYVYCGHGSSPSEALTDLAKVIEDSGGRSWQQDGVLEIAADIRDLAHNLQKEEEEPCPVL